MDNFLLNHPWFVYPRAPCSEYINYDVYRYEVKRLYHYINDINDYQCKKCNEKNKELFYCLNDDIYLCQKCDVDVHENNNKVSNALKKHRRIRFSEYELLHTNICKIHEKPYEIYCPECEEIFCIKCRSTEIHSFNHDKSEMIYLNSSLLEEISMKQTAVKKNNI